jgi:hypothetical protein
MRTRHRLKNIAGASERENLRHSALLKKHPAVKTIDWPECSAALSCPQKELPIQWQRYCRWECGLGDAASLEDLEEMHKRSFVLLAIGDQLKALYEREQSLPMSERLAKLVRELESRPDFDWGEPEQSDIGKLEKMR